MLEPAYVCATCGTRYGAAGTCHGSQLAETTDALLGAEIGSYRLTRVLGRGGMGRVYLGVQGSIGARVAIKVLSEDACDEPEAVERFLTEARAVNMIRHHAIIGVHDFLMLPGKRPAIVMELVEGPTLRELIERGPVPIADAIAIVGDVLAALAAAHDIGIVHRDLKPDNIIVAANGRAKLLDFGIAKLALGAPGVPRTRTGAVLGTPHYMSPEQIQGDVVDARSDIYAMGVLLFETLAGRRPFDGATDFELMVAHVEAPPPSLRTLRSAVPAAVDQIVTRALAKRRADRYASATAMADALRAAGSIQPSRPGGRTRVVAVGVAAALALGATSFALVRGGGGGDPIATEADTRELAPVADRTVSREAPAPPPSPVVDRPRAHRNAPTAPPRVEPIAAQPIVDGPLRLPPDYDIHNLDVTGWLASAQRLALRKATVARIVSFTLAGVGRDGRIDLRPAAGGADDRYVEIDYYAAEPPCRIRVIAGDDHVTVLRTGSMSSCSDSAPPPPRCSLAGVWARGLAQLKIDVDAGAIAKIEWDGLAHHWVWTVGKHGGIVLDDRC